MIGTDHLVVIYTYCIRYRSVRILFFFFLFFFFFCCYRYCSSSSNDCKTMLPHLLVLYTSYIRSRYVCTEEERREREREKEQKKKGERWNCTVTGTNPFCLHRYANRRLFVFRIFASFSRSVTKDKCLFY